MRRIETLKNPGIRPNMPAFQKEYDKALGMLGKIDGLTGVGVGRKVKDGQRTDELVVKFTVREKKGKKDIKKSQVLPTKIGKARTDVVQGTPRLAADRWNGRYSVLQPGMSVSGPTTLGLAGSLGPVVIDSTDGWPGILTCWHVLSSGYTIDDYAIHPGSLDGGSGPYDSIGAVERSMLSGSGDAALIRLSPHAGMAPLGAHYAFRAVKNAEIGDSLEKSGRSTEITTGEVTGYSTHSFDYSDWGHGGIAITCVEIQPNSGDTAEEIVAIGDSGSAWWIPSTEEVCGITLGHIPGDPFTALAMDLTEALTHLYCDVPAVVDSSLFQVGTFNVANRRKIHQVGTTLICDARTFLGVQVSAYESGSWLESTLASAGVTFE